MPTADIFYVHSNSEVGGGNKVLLRLMDRIDRAKFCPIAFIPDEGPLRQELGAIGTPCYVVDSRLQQISHGRAALSVLKMLAARIRRRPRILHSNEMPYRLTSVACVGMRRVCHVHHPGFDRNTLRWLFRIPPHMIVTPSDFIREEVVRCLDELGLKIPVEVVWNPIDTDWFRPPASKQVLKSRLGLSQETQHVSILGTLAPHKGHVCFLKMAKLVSESRPLTDFHIIGGGRERDEDYIASLKLLVEDLGLADRVRFWGLVDDSRARDVLAASDLFVLPSREEGFGLVLAEAQACEVPVLTTRMRPLDEVVEDTRTGYLVTQDDDQQFARIAIELLGDEGKRQEMGIAGRISVERRFGTPQFVERMTEIYSSVLEPSRATRGAT